MKKLKISSKKYHMTSFQNIPLSRPSQLSPNFELKTKTFLLNFDFVLFFLFYFLFLCFFMTQKHFFVFIFANLLLRERSLRKKIPKLNFDIKKLKQSPKKNKTKFKSFHDQPGPKIKLPPNSIKKTPMKIF